MSLTRLDLPSASRFRALTCASLLSAACALQIAAAADADEGGLAEIVVTAQRFTSTIQNTPISLSAVSGDQLDAAGITRVEALAHEVPGLSMRSAGPGQTEYEARGLASNGGSPPTVGFYLDEVPLSPPATSQTGKVVIDPNLYDIDRIEVLRGPQGTLYGSGSMGGTVKIDHQSAQARLPGRAPCKERCPTRKAAAATAAAASCSTFRSARPSHCAWSAPTPTAAAGSTGSS